MKVNIPLPQETHRKLTEKAKAAKLSVNEYVKTLVSADLRAAGLLPPDEKPKINHSLVDLTVMLTPGQTDYLDCIGKQLRAPIEDVLVALAFGLLESDETSGEHLVDSYTQLLRDFVDERKVPSADPDIGRYVSVGKKGADDHRAEVLAAVEEVGFDKAMAALRKAARAAVGASTKGEART